MNKKILLEELTRIHQIMGIKSKKPRFLMETIIKPSKSIDMSVGSSVDAAVKSTMEAEVTAWAKNAGLKKVGNVDLSYGDIVAHGKKLAKEAGEEITDEAAAITYFAKKSGKNHFDDLLANLSKKLKSQADVAFKAQADAIASETAKKQVVAVFENSIKGKDLTDPALDLELIERNLINFRAGIDASTMTTAEKKALKDLIDEQIDIVNAAKDIKKTDPDIPLENQLAKEIDVESTPKVDVDVDAKVTPGKYDLNTKEGREAAWPGLVAEVNVSFGTTIKSNAEELVQFKKEFVDGNWEFGKTRQNIQDWVDARVKQSTDMTLSETQRAQAKKQLEQIKMYCEGVLGFTVKSFDQLSGLLKTTLRYTGAGLNAAGELKRPVLGLIGLLGLTYLGLSADEILEYFTAKTEVGKCLYEIPGYTDVLLDTNYFLGRDSLSTFFESEYTKEEVCTADYDIDVYKKIKRMEYSEVEDTMFTFPKYEIKVIYEQCQDIIYATSDGSTFKVKFQNSQKKCGPFPRKDIADYTKKSSVDENPYKKNPDDEKNVVTTTVTTEDLKAAIAYVKNTAGNATPDVKEVNGEIIYTDPNNIVFKIVKDASGKWSMTF